MSDNYACTNVLKLAQAYREIVASNEGKPVTDSVNVTSGMIMKAIANILDQYHLRSF